MKVLNGTHIARVVVFHMQKHSKSLCLSRWLSCFFWTNYLKSSSLLAQSGTPKFFWWPRCAKFADRTIKLYSDVVGRSNFLANPKVQQYVEQCVSEYNEHIEQLLSNSTNEHGDPRQNTRSVKQLQSLVEVYTQLKEKKSELKEYDSFLADLSMSKKEEYSLVKTAKQEQDECLRDVSSLENQVLDLLIPEEPLDDNDIILEVTSGVGGQEAMLFARDIFSMYEQMSANMGWAFDVYSYATTELGGIRHASASISGVGVYRYLKFEGGVHRVQRVPKTEKYGRVHTSTATVAVLPQPDEIDIVLNNKDLKFEYMRSSGKGGQSVNVTDSCVRIVHLPTGIAVECQVERSQIQNKERAMKILKAKLFEKERDEQIADITSRRKLQVGSRQRSEKVRTYNYQQDRITDHRIGFSTFDMQNFLSGGPKLQEIISALLEEDRKEKLLEFIQEKS